MKKQLLIFIVVVLVLLILPTTVLAAWTEKVTGSMEDSANYPGMSISLVAWDNGDGTFGGNGEYAYGPWQWHLDVKHVCFGSTPDGHAAVIAIGTVKDQVGNLNLAEGSDWGFLAVRDGNDGEHDRLRAGRGITQASAIGYYDSLAGNVWPAEVTVGDFNIREK